MSQLDSDIILHSQLMILNEQQDGIDVSHLTLSEITSSEDQAVQAQAGSFFRSLINKMNGK